VDDVRELLAGGQMTSRREEAFPIDEPMSAAVDDGLVRQAGPVVPGGKAGLGQPEQLEESIEARVLVELSGLGRAEHASIARRELHQRLRAHRALDVTVQLDLWEAVKRLGGREGVVAVQWCPSCARPDGIGHTDKLPSPS